MLKNGENPNRDLRLPNLRIAMTIKRMDNVLIVVEDLDAAKPSSPSSAWSWRARRRSRGRGWTRPSGSTMSEPGLESSVQLHIESPA
jgi:hypothetical protein